MVSGTRCPAWSEIEGTLTITLTSTAKNGDYREYASASAYDYAITDLGKPKLFPSGHISVHRNRTYISLIFSVVANVKSEGIPFAVCMVNGLF